MKKLLLLTVIMSFAVLTFANPGKKQGPDPKKGIDTMTNEQLVKEIKKLKSQMTKVEKKLDGKISAVQVNLDTYANDNNEAVGNLNTNIDNAKKDFTAKWKATNDSLKAMNDSTGVLTLLKKGNKNNNEKATLARNIGFGAGGLALIALIVLFVNKRSGRRAVN